jgi:uncharacterized protein (TIGR03067 family)
VIEATAEFRAGHMSHALGPPRLITSVGRLGAWFNSKLLSVRHYTKHMKYIICMSLALAASLNALAADQPDDAKAVQGNWKPAKAELAGQPMTDAVLQSISLKLDNGKYEVFVGDIPDRGTYTLDSATKPKSMTITGTDGPNRGKTFPAIYEFKGDTLRICYDLSGAKRPTEFKSVAGTKLYLVTYSRKKD